MRVISEGIESIDFDEARVPISNGDGFFTLTNRTNGFVIDGAGATTEGANPVQSVYTGATSQQWSITDTGTGVYVIANRATGGMTLLERTVNGQPGLVAQQDGITVTVFAFDVAGDRIKHIWAIRNPDKLRPWMAG